MFWITAKKAALIIIITMMSVNIGNAQNRGASFYFPNSTSGYAWQLSSNACAGCGSAYVGISVDAYPNKFGNYTYNVFLSGNSFDIYGNQSLSYITNINIYVYNYTTRQYVLLPGFIPIQWFVVGHLETYFYTFYSTDSRLPVLIKWGNITSYY